MSLAERVVRVLESLGAPYALIGGQAVTARGYPRLTVDYDFLTTDARVLRRETWSALSDAGVAVDPRRGDLDDPLAGVVHLSAVGEAEVDVLLAKWKWEAAVLARAERLDLGAFEAPVPRTADLILLKLAAGGGIDIQDAMVLLGTANREELIAAVESYLGDLDADAQAAWDRVKADGALGR
ncbi:MAG TPA: hypothetical protein VGV61_16085 [Thermoanaerobaculia bacterium]|jgi:hypothetical protein|nr:hypothetical protein [Thermoanaerobaculia bacterium]